MPTNRFYISVLCEINKPIPNKTPVKKPIGIDLGIKHFLITSENKIFENQKYFKSYQLKLKREQRSLQRKEKSSKNREKQRIKVAKIHEKITNSRNNFHHHVCNWLLNNYDTVCIEDLYIKSMLSNKNKSLNKNISDVAWNSFISILSYKSEWYGNNLIKIDKYFPSSKTCSKCGQIKNDLTLNDRIYHCDNCKSMIDRDLNAAINILNKGLGSNHYALTASLEAVA